MALIMTRPTQHPKTGIYVLRKGIPRQLREITKRKHGVRAEFIESLGTRDPAEAKRLAPAVLALFQSYLDAAQAEHSGTAASLTDAQISALCGQWLRNREAEAAQNIPESFNDTDWCNDLLQALQPEADPEIYGGRPIEDAVLFMDRDVTALLSEAGLHADAESVERLSVRLLSIWHTWSRDLARRAENGTWRQTLRCEDFAAITMVEVVAPKGHSTVSFDAILDTWAADNGLSRSAKPVQRRFYDRLRTIERLAAFLGHRDASKVTREDAVRWKQDAQSRGSASATIRNDLSEMSAVWKCAAANALLPDGQNPFAGILPKKAKQPSQRRAFTKEEAALILGAARRQTGALRWLPWVCAMTGARIQEIVQSHKHDVCEIDGIPALRITDEGGAGQTRSLKNADSRRTIPLHPALIKEGWLDYVNALPAGSPLFPDISPDALFGLRAGPASEIISAWLRDDLGITDKRISPSHSWRHWFIQACRSAVINQEVRSALTGHAAGIDESSGYGEGMGALLHVLAENIAKVVPPIPAL